MNSCSGASFGSGAPIAAERLVGAGRGCRFGTIFPRSTGVPKKSAYRSNRTHILRSRCGGPCPRSSRRFSPNEGLHGVCRPATYCRTQPASKSAPEPPWLPCLALPCVLCVVWRVVCCALCVVCCVLCVVCCVLCAVCCVLCAVCCVPFAVRCVLCVVCCALCMLCAVRAARCVLRTV